MFANINCNYATDPSPDTSANTFRPTSACADINTTPDPGGRIGQLVASTWWRDPEAAPPGLFVDA